MHKKPHTEVSKFELREMVALAKISFDKAQSVTYERYKLFNREQKTGETLEAFQAALTAQAARAELGTLENELVRDLFISKMKNTALQDTLTFETFTPDTVLKRAMKFEQSKQTTQAFQKSNTIATGASQVDGTMKKKQQLIMNVGKRARTVGDNRGNNTRHEQLTANMEGTIQKQNLVLDAVGHLEKAI